MNTFDVEKNTIFLTLAGSHSYGTNSKDSDLDYRGVCVPSNRSYYIGMGINTFEQKDKGWPKDVDKVIYDLRKFFKLAADNNPNILDILFVDFRFWKKTSRIWDKIVRHRTRFLSKKVKHTYSGYAHSQIKRIQRHRSYLLYPPIKKPERKDFNLPDRKTISREQMGAYEWLIAKLLEGTLEELNLSDSTLNELKNVNYIGLTQSKIPEDCYKTIQQLTGATDEWIACMMNEKQYFNALSDWKSYQNWKNTRNPKRAILEKKYGYDCKHATQTVRLMRQGSEILKSGKVNVYRPDREELMSIRNGAWSYERLLQYSEDMSNKLEKLYHTSSLPKQPDRIFLDELCQDLIEQWVFKK